MIDFIIVNDNELQRKKITSIIIEKMMCNKIEFNIHEFSNYDSKEIDKISNYKLNKIYIIDLKEHMLDGADIASEIRYKQNNWNSPIIIFADHISLYYKVYQKRLNILDIINNNLDIKKLLSENIDICLQMLDNEKVYRYTYKNVDYKINLNHINYIKRDGRKTKIVTKNFNYYQNISINQIKKVLPDYFLISTKGIMINLKNVKKIDWQNHMVVFNDNSNGYLVSNSHRKEIESFDLI